jgi:acetyltransferase-like isoleucine patch superfamily enzyme
VIEATAVVIGPTEIADSAYVGHFSILGMGPPSGRFGIPAPSGAETWTESRGVHVDADVVIGPHVVIDDGTRIGPRVFVGAGVRIGHDTVIQADAEIYYQAQVFDRVRIGAAATIGGFVCNDAVVGERATVFGKIVHRFVDATLGTPEVAPIIEADAFVGMDAIVIGGISIGATAYVAAGAVVTTNVPAGRLVRGNPARDCGLAPAPLAGNRS